MPRAKIKPCPGCGGLPTLNHIRDGKYFHSCDYSDCTLDPVTPAYKNKGSATRAWNKRYTKDIEVAIAKKIFEDLDGFIIGYFEDGQIIWESDVYINDLKKKYGVIE